MNTSCDFASAPGGKGLLKVVPPSQRYIEALTPSTCECVLVGKQDHCS